MRESIFKASVRAFFLALFSIAGIVFGILFVGSLLGGIFSSVDSKPELTYKFTPEIRPNAENVRVVESDSAPVILKLNISGVIGMDSLTRGDIAQLLVESRERSLVKDRVKAILLFIDSPGGTVIDSDGIYREIKAYKQKYNVPVYAFIDGFCASGGFYIAGAADKVFSSDSSLVGSVGVLLPSIMNFSQLMEKVGVQSLTLYEGKGKDNLNPFRPWRKGEEDNIQDSISYFYEMFVNIVTAARPNLDKAKLAEEYGANIYPAKVAKDKGYIDEANYTENQVLKLLVESIGIKDDFYQVVELGHKSWVSELFKSQFNLFSGKITHEISLSPDLPAELTNQYLYLYRP